MVLHQFTLCDMLNWYHPSRPLRSGAFPSLTPNRHNTIMYGCRLCDTAAATIGNNLPINPSSLHAQIHYLHSRDNKNTSSLNLNIY